MNSGNGSSSATSCELDETTRNFIAMLFDAARADDAAKLCEFLDQGLPVDLVNEKGDSLLMVASYNGNVAATRLLLERGAKTEMLNSRGQTPLAGAAFKGNTTIAGLLIDHGAHVNGKIAGGKTPLIMAAMFDRVEMLELLTARGAHTKLRSDDGTSAYDAANLMGARKALAWLDKHRGKPGRNR